MELEETRNQISACIQAGDITKKVIAALLHGTSFVPAEGSLFDYKRDVPTEKAELLSILRHIAAFHNTYGGYLIFGAEEVEKNTKIVPCHASISDLDSKKLRDLISSHLNTSIEIQSAKLAYSIENNSFELVVLHIPKRQLSEPVTFVTTGYIDAKRKAFEADQVYLREGDSSVPAAKPWHWKLIYGSRINPYNATALSEPIRTPLENNLPDRGFIYQKFIGRQDTLSRLWQWLADDFSCVKVLAGEGGLGKTSIAYEFAQDVCKTRPREFELVVWLTAKEKQFRALSNNYVAVPVTHFDSAVELFRQMVLHLGGTDEEVRDAIESVILKRLQLTLRSWKTFFVIDDLDSLTPDDQRRSIEVCQHMSGSGSKFLFTTRKNATASTTSAIELTGFVPEDFRDFVADWTARLKCPSVRPSDMPKLEAVTGRSPLYTESVLRLLKLGISFQDATEKWRRELGVEVRKATLEREVLQLSPSARKILVAVSVFSEASYAEIKQSAGYTDQTLSDGLTELETLFLINVPQIGRAKRYAVSQTTRSLVFEIGHKLISDYQTYAQQLKSDKYRADSIPTRYRIVGAAINQALAYLADHNPLTALATVDDANSTFEGRNPDLLFMRARVLECFTPPRIADARTALTQAFDYGQRKEHFFHVWYAIEHNEGANEAAIDVCDKAIACKLRNDEWRLKRAQSRLLSAAEQDTGGDRDHARTQLSKAAEDLLAAKRSNPDLQHDASWHMSLQLAHDRLWSLTARTAGSTPDWISVLDVQLQAVERKDFRPVVYARVALACSKFFDSLGERPNQSVKAQNLLYTHKKRALAVFAAAPRSLKGNEQFQEAQTLLEGLT